jgi:hypothetical protein
MDTVAPGSNSSSLTGRGDHQLDLAARTASRLLTYCEANDWSGYDPYDALNSELFKALPALDTRIVRLALTQLLKRINFNLRPLLKVPKTQNAKALALFLSSFVKLSQAGLLDRTERIEEMVDKLAGHASGAGPYWAWGYSFPWQTRTKLVPRGVPNLVCTTFVANALLDAYAVCRLPRCLDMAVSAADYILAELYWTEGESVAGFAYPLPSMRQQIHNANLLGAALFCRVSGLTGEKKFLSPAFKAARYSAGKQRPDGSWAYGEGSTQQWVDNFHTGYNLGALRSIGLTAETTEFEPHVRRGLDFYLRHFFRSDGAPRYYHNKTYPIDAHCVAQSIITLIQLRDLNDGSVTLACRVLDWAMANLWNERGYFYYRVLPFWRIKTSYMRWTQAWMFQALCTFLDAGRKVVPLNTVKSAALRESVTAR